MNILFLQVIALGLAAGVLAAPLPPTQASTRNVCVDKLEIRNCALVRRGDDDSQIGPQPAHPSRAERDKFNERRRTARALKEAPTPEAKRQAKIASNRAYRKRLATQNPEKFKILREAKAARTKARLMTFAIENPEDFKRLKEASAARRKAKLMALAIENPEKLKSLKEVAAAREKARHMAFAIERPEEMKRRKEAKLLYNRTKSAANKLRVAEKTEEFKHMKEGSALYGKNGRITCAAEKPEEVKRRIEANALYGRTRRAARAQSPKMVADQEAKTVVGQKYHRDKEAAEQQALTPPFFTHPASPSTKQAPSLTVQVFEAARLRAIHWKNKRYRTKREGAQPLVADPAGSSRRQTTSPAVRPHQILRPNADAGSFAPRQYETSLQAAQPTTHQEDSDPEVDVLQWLVDTTPPTSPDVA